MSLKDELKLRKGFENIRHEAVISIYHTASKLKHRADAIFNEFELTDVQYNLLALILEQSENGLSQKELSEMMLVNRANITTLIDRMEKKGLVKRCEILGDRRKKLIKATKKGGKTYIDSDKKYVNGIKELTSNLNNDELNNLINLLGKIRIKL